MNDMALITKDQAIREIHGLMAQYDIDLADLAATRPDGRSNLLTKVMVYLGGILVIAGLTTYLGMQWNDLDSFLRVVLTYGPGLIAFICGLIALKYETKSGTAIAAPLLLIAALYQSAGLFVFLGEYSEGQDAPLGALMVFGVMSLQFLAAFTRYKTPALALFTLVFAHFAFAALFEKMEIEPRYYTATLGLSGLMIAGAISKTRYASITGLGFIFSGFSFTSALYVILENTSFDVLLIGVAALMIYVSVLIERRTLLFVAVMTTIGYLGYYTEEYFKDVVGWPIALMVLGVLLIIGSHYAIRIGRRFHAAA